MKKKICIISIIIFVLASVFWGYEKINSPYITVLMYHNVIDKNDVPKKYLDENGNIKDKFIV